MTSCTEIGPLPAPRSPSRRRMCAQDLDQFIRLYFPLRNAPNEKQAALLARHQLAILSGGLQVNRVDRGLGTTQAIIDTLVWALMNGHTRYAVVISPTFLGSMTILDSVKCQLQHNIALRGDFPESCEAIAQADGFVQRFYSQTCNGRSTHVRWTGQQIVLPTINEVPGPCLAARGVIGSFVGMGHRVPTMPGGEIVRPDLIIVDGHQTNQSNESLSQSQRRLRIVNQTVTALGGGPDSCTVIVDEFRHHVSVTSCRPCRIWDVRSI